jgi:1,4-dihydroxy-2-naphthoate octaprenyltransferase
MRIWLMAARVRTLPAAVAPVLVGTAVPATGGTFRAGAFVAALLGALLIQVGTNLSNDYSDARRGATRTTGSGPCASPRAAWSRRGRCSWRPP